MKFSKEYFHDRMVLLLITVNTFLTGLGSLLVLLRLNPGRNQGYISQYSKFGIVHFNIGHASDLLAFIGFLVIVLLFSVVLSSRVYQIHRQFAITTLAMGLLLMVLAIIVSYALLTNS